MSGNKRLPPPPNREKNPTFWENNFAGTLGKYFRKRNCIRFCRFRRCVCRLSFVVESQMFPTPAWLRIVLAGAISKGDERYNIYRDTYCNLSANINFT